MCNSYSNNSTKLSPYFLEYGQNTLLHSYLLFTDGSAAINETKWFLDIMKKANKSAQTSILSANTRNADDANTIQYDFEVGENGTIINKTFTIATSKNKEVL